MLPLIALVASGLCLTSNVLAANIHTGNRINHRRINQLERRYDYEDSDSDSDSLPQVPTYNFSMPVDHFDQSNEKTFPNRFFVNDTHYQAGGPVIFYDFGESGVDPISLASTLSEYAGSTSVAMTLAAEVHGLVVGWEHRYYGYSQPVRMDSESGLPADGVDGYKYLTVEQGLEDVVYFANRFNQTKLPHNHAVNSTAKLDPYNTPWIFIGGSYPGSRAAWIRAKYPEIIYASWASSAPLQSQFDGSIYINPLMRALPKNCSNDVVAAVKYNDDVLTSGSASEVEFVIDVVSEVSSAVPGSSSADVEEMDPYQIGNMLYQGLTFSGQYQYLGPTGSVQIMCDAMESFDTDEFFEAYNDRRGDSEYKAESILDNSADYTPPSEGVASSVRSNAGLSAFAALAYGLNVSLSEALGSSDTSDTAPFTPSIDDASWQWQTVSEVGWFQGSNDSHAFRAISKFTNLTAVRQGYVDFFDSVATSKSGVPDQINNTYLLDVGGWNAKISNVMFTNGEFDPWRAFSVASQETEDGAPGRNMTRAVPECNQVAQGTDVFGLIYPGEVHASDISVTLDSSSSNGTTRPPPEVGLELFLEAWKVWEPCFQKSRDDVRNGQGVDGQGNDASGKEGKDSAASGMGSGGLLPFLVSSSLIVGFLYM